MEQFVLFDFRGCLMHSYFSGTDPDGVLDAENQDVVVNTAGWGMRNFVEQYLIPALNFTSTNNIIVCLEGGNQRRQSIFPEYKAHRKSQHSVTVSEQLATLQEKMLSLLLYLGIPTCKVDGAEADDLIAYLTKQLHPNAINIMTVDKDLVQLASSQVFVIVKRNDTTEINEDVPSHLTSLYKALVGDKSDGYGGVTGFGPAAWKSLKEQYGVDGLEQIQKSIASSDPRAIVSSLQEQPDKALSKIIDQWQQVCAMFAVASLHPEWCEFRYGNRRCAPVWEARLPSKKVVTSILTEFGLNSFLTDLSDFLPSYTLLTADVPDIGSVIQRLTDIVTSSNWVSFDIETWAPVHAPFVEAAGSDYVDVLSSKIVGASLSFGAHQQYTVYLCFDHKDTANLDKEVLVQILRAAEKAGTKIVAHNASFEMTVVDTDLGYRIGSMFDTMIMSSYVDENRSAGLKSLSLEVLRHKQTAYKDVVPDGLDMRGVTGKQVFSYGADDAICTAALFRLFKTILMVENTWTFYSTYDVDSVHFIVDAYKAGINIDWKEMENRHKEDVVVIEKSDAELRGLLEEHCSEVNMQGYKTLLDEKSSYIKAVYKDKARDKGWSNQQLQEEVDRKIESESLRLKSACRYLPLQQVPVGGELKPTVGTLSAACKAIGIDPIEKLTKQYMATWGDEVTLRSSPEQRQFKNAVKSWAALPWFTSQFTSPEYQTVLGYVLKYVPRRMETIGTQLNLGSPVQKSDLLYGMMNLPIRNRTRPQPGSLRDRLGLDGGPSTNDNAMDTAIVFDLDKDDWRVKALHLIQGVQSASTRIGLYYIPYPLFRHPKDGLIHPSIRNCGTVTRRPTGGKPNILQVSKHKDDGKMRRLFLTAAEDHVIISIDFSQEELMIMAVESQDPMMLSCYLGDNKKDIHSLTGSGFAGVPYEEFVEVLKDENNPLMKEYKAARTRAKPFNFGIGYGAVAATVARNEKMEFEVAKKLFEAWLQTYANIKPWQDNCLRMATRLGYVKTAFGNRRHIDDRVLSGEEWQKQRAGRQAANSVIQGTGADILKIVMTEMHRKEVFKLTGAIPVVPLYDEIVASVPRHTAYEYIRMTSEIMTITPPNYPYSMVPDASLGSTWGSQIELGQYPSEEKVNDALMKLNT